MAPFLEWLQASLLASFPSDVALPPLDLEDHIKVRQNRLLVQMYPAGTPVSTRGAPTIIIQAPQRVQQVTNNKKDNIPTEIW